MHMRCSQSRRLGPSPKSNKSRACKKCRSRAIKYSVVTCLKPEIVGVLSVGDNQTSSTAIPIRMVTKTPSPDVGL